jgi:organic radical activating enzyme
MEVEDITAQAVIATGGSRLVIISGGEPLAQTPPRFQGKRVASIAADPLGLLIYNLYIRNVGTHIETAGIRVPSDLVNDHVGRYVVSPKLETSGNKLVQRHVPEALTFFAGTYKADFKFVITSPTDFIEIDSIIKAYSIQPSRVWCMPEGTTPEAVQRSMPMIAAEALQRGYNVCTRLHVLIWGDERAH